MEHENSRSPKQRNRSVTTTNRILDATVQCLIERGYAGTSTAEVCRLSGAARGTLLHHFPTKASLVTGAVAHVLDKSVEEFKNAIVSGPQENPGARGFAEALWKLWCRDTFYAWLELIVASRTDPELNRHIQPLMEMWESKVFSTYQDMFAREGVGPVKILFRMLNALAIERIYSGDRIVAQSLDDFLAFVDVLDRLLLGMKLVRHPQT